MTTGKTGNRFATALMILAFTVAAAISGCGKVRETVSIAGSSTLQPALAECARLFENDNPGIRVQIDGGGSIHGIAGALTGTADIGALSRGLSAEEKEFDLNETIIGYDGVALIVNPGNPVGNLTRDQVTDLFTGKILNWKEVGGADAPVVPIMKSPSHGTQKVFAEYFSLGKRRADGALQIDANMPTIEEVRRTSGAIGFLSIGAVDREEASKPGSVKRLSLDGILPTRESVKAQTYGLVRPLLLVTRGKPQGAVKRFIEFTLSPPAQAMIEREDFVKVTEADWNEPSARVGGQGNRV